MTALPALAEDPVPEALPVPSGQTVYWLDTIRGNPGALGLTYRFRFVAPDLAMLVPMAEPAPMDDLTEEEMAALQDLAATEADPGASILSEALGDGLIAAGELDQLPTISFQGIEAATEALAAPPPEDEIDGDPSVSNFVLPRAPDSLVRDPMHDDIVWLCEHFVLPRLASADPRPSEIVISLSDRPLVSTELALGAVQLFEAFSLPADRDECVWEPF
ncbi:DUF6497 family protein [Paracoccus isoporae]|nr:DUF6497 family protein [Paracoccus isoporae]